MRIAAVFYMGLCVENKTVGFIQRSDAYKGLTDAEIKGSAVLQSVVEVIRTVGASPIDLNIFAAGEEIADQLRQGDVPGGIHLPEKHH